MNTSDIGAHAVKQGASLALQYFQKRSELTIDLKGHQDYISEADLAVEALIRQIITKSFPNDGFLGEEYGQKAGTRQWVIDPIDGTTNFLRGIPYFCTTLALVDNEEVISGWIYDPVHEDLYSAHLNSGAWKNTEKLETSWRTSLDTALVGICHSSLLTAQELTARMEGVLQRGSILRQPGAGGLMLCDLACGKIDVLFDQHLKPWDAIAGLLIAFEAGAIVSDYLYNSDWRITSQPTFACGPEIYAEVCDLWPLVQKIPLLQSNR